MTARKAKPLGSTIDVPEGAQVIRPGASEAEAITVTGGAYVLDSPGVHIIDGAEQPVYSPYGSSGKAPIRGGSDEAPPSP